MRLITLTLKEGVKVYVNPEYIIAVCERGFGTTSVDIIGELSSLEVLEGAESIAKMVEGEQNG